MEILWLAIVFYSVGLAALLHFRPAYMFNETGTWKEFGYHRAASARYTLFPVWLFAVVWAIVSYALAAAITWTWRLSSSPASSFAAASAMGSAAMTGRTVRFAEPAADVFDEQDDEDDDGMENIMLPVSAAPNAQPAMTETIRMRPSAKRIQTPARQPRMGYYVLDPASEKSGLRRYIYYGNAPPADSVVQGASAIQLNN